MPSNVLPLVLPGWAPGDIRRSIVTLSSALLTISLVLGAACILLCYTGSGRETVFWPMGSVALLLLGAAAGITLAGRMAKPVDVLATNLRFAEARHESFWAHCPECLFMIEVTADERFVFVGMNPALERLTGLSPTQVMGKEPRECLPPEMAASVTNRYRDCVRRGEAISYDEELAFPGGRRFWRTSLSPVRDPATGRITFLLGIAQDMTPDLQARAELQCLNERLNSILASVSDCYCTFDREYRMTAVNSSALKWLGLSEDAALGTPYAEAYAGPHECARVTRHVMEHRVPAHVEVPSGLRPGRWLDYHVYPSEEGVSVFFRDITEAKAAREELEEISRQLRVVQEEERRQIASELHDSTAQHLVAAGLNLMRLPDGGDEHARLIREEIGTSLDEALKEIRVFTYLLHPPGLHADGLAATLRTFVEGFGRRTGLEVTFHASPALGNLGDDLQRSILRVVQEGLLNTHRHADASRVSVNAKLLRRTLFVRIQDDGCGMSEETGQPASPATMKLGVGIPGMRARLRQFGGELRIRSCPGRTTLFAIVPLTNVRPEEVQQRLPRFQSATQV